MINLAFGLSNSNKAYAGRLDGLNDPYLMKKKELKEQQVRSNVTVEGTDPWQEIEEAYQESGKYYAETLLLSKSGGTREKVSRLIFLLEKSG